MRHRQSVSRAADPGEAPGRDRRGSGMARDALTGRCSSRVSPQGIRISAARQPWRSVAVSVLATRLPRSRDTCPESSWPRGRTRGPAHHCCSQGFPYRPWPRLVAQLLADGRAKAIAWESTGVDEDLCATRRWGAEAETSVVTPTQQRTGELHWPSEFRFVDPGCSGGGVRTTGAVSLAPVPIVWRWEHIAERERLPCRSRATQQLHPRVGLGELGTTTGAHPPPYDASRACARTTPYEEIQSPAGHTILFSVIACASADRYDAVESACGLHRTQQDAGLCRGPIHPRQPWLRDGQPRRRTRVPRPSRRSSPGEAARGPSRGRA